jgi:hypothetical protein
MTWWHPLWIHVDCTFYSLSWCLRHQGHLRDCLKCVLIGKQLSNNWTLSALQVNARENIAADRRVAPMADALWSPDVWTSTMTRVLCKPGLPRKYSWNILIPAWVASQVLEKHHEISAISVSFFGHVRGSGPASSWLSKQSSGEHSWHPKSQVTFSRSQHQEGLKSECKHNYMYIYIIMYTSLITRCSSPVLSVSRPTCNALATPAKEADVGGEDSTSCVWFPWENDQRFGVMRCSGFIHPSILVPKVQGNFIYNL